MSLNAYLSLKGVKQGVIKGGVTQKGREGHIVVYGFNHEIKSPRDMATGQASGKRQHSPLLITKEIDKSTPLLLKALVTNETLQEVILYFYGAVSRTTGVETLIYTIKLTNAAITNIEGDMELNKIEPGKTLPVLEHVSFTYEKIEWTWIDGGIMSQDDWSETV